MRPIRFFAVRFFMWIALPSVALLGFPTPAPAPSFWFDVDVCQSRVDLTRGLFSHICAVCHIDTRARARSSDHRSEGEMWPFTKRPDVEQADKSVSARLDDLEDSQKHI